MKKQKKNKNRNAISNKKVGQWQNEKSEDKRNRKGAQLNLKM